MDTATVFRKCAWAHVPLTLGEIREIYRRMYKEEPIRVGSLPLDDWWAVCANSWDTGWEPRGGYSPRFFFFAEYDVEPT